MRSADWTRDADAIMHAVKDLGDAGAKVHLIDVAAPERSRCHLAELDGSFASIEGADESERARRIALPEVEGRSALRISSDAARWAATSAPVRVAGRSDRACECDSCFLDKAVRRTSVPAAGTTRAASTPASAPSVGTVSSAAASLLPSEATSSARGAGPSTGGEGGSADFDLTGASAGAAGDAGADAAATGGSGRAAGAVGVGNRGNGSM